MLVGVQVLVLMRVLSWEMPWEGLITPHHHSTLRLRGYPASLLLNISDCGCC
jgi:hypothetical protein